MFNHNWSYHQHIADGFHGNLRTEIQVFRCRNCGVTKQLPANLDQKPSVLGCIRDKPIVEKVKDFKDPIEEKGDYDEPVRAGKQRKGKNDGR